MQDILRTNDPVLLSFVGALLREAKISHHVADAHISVLEGSIGAFLQRVMVADDDAGEARRLLIEAGLAAELMPPPLAGGLPGETADLPPPLLPDGQS